MRLHDLDAGGVIKYAVTPIIVLLLIFAGGVTLAVLSFGQEIVGPDILFVGEQSSITVLPDSQYAFVNVILNSTQPSNTSTYVFTSKLAHKNSTKTLPVFTMTDATSSCFFIPRIVPSTVSFKLDVNNFVDIKYVGDYNNASTIIMEDKSVAFLEGQFEIDKAFELPHFLINGSNKYSGTFSVNITGLQWNTMTGFVYECHAYPCELDISGSQFDHRALWIITENNSTNVYETQSDLSYLFVNTSSFFISISSFV